MNTQHVTARGFHPATRLVQGLVAAAVCIAALAGAVTSAGAADTAVWSGASPAAGSVQKSRPASVFITADDAAPILTATVTLNGVPSYSVFIDYAGYTVFDEESESYQWVVTDRTKAQIVGYFPANQYLVGTNTVVTTVTSALGVSTNTRTFTYGALAPTTVSTVSPASGAELPASPASISAAVSSGATSFTSTMRVDGAVVPTTFNAASKTFTYAVASDLTAGRHTVDFSVTPSGGTAVTKSWTFAVKTPMSTAWDCAGCHAVTASTHSKSGCEDCHDHAYVVPGGTHGRAVPTVAGCMGDGVVNPAAACHQLDHTGDAGWGAGPFACTDCHRSANAAVPQHTSGSLDTAHAVPGGPCEGCHAASLLAEHAKYPAADAMKYQCDLCHGAGASQRVKNAVAAGGTDCTGCHDMTSHPAIGAEGHAHFESFSSSQAYRATPYWPTLTSVATGTCSNCHTGQGAATRAAGNALCATCHDAAGLNLTGYGYPGKATYALSSHAADPVAVRRVRTIADYAEGTFSNTASSASDGKIRLLGGPTANLAYGKGIMLDYPTTSAYGTPLSDYTDGNAGTGGFFRGWIEIKGMAFPTGVGTVYARVDLGQECNITGVRVRTGGYMGAPADTFTGGAQYSFPTVGTLGVPNGNLSMTFPPQRNRYVAVQISKRMYYYDPVDISSIGLNEIEVYGDAMTGTWTSPVIDISDSRPVTGATLSWKADGPKAGAPYDADWDDIIDTFPRDATATVDAQVSFNGGSTWTDWQRLVLTPGTTSAPLPMLPAGTDISNARIRYRANLDRCDVPSGVGPVIGDFALSIGHAPRNAATTYPGSGAGAGECANCHDPHGTNGSGNARAAGNELCFGCHDAAGIAPEATYRYKGRGAYTDSAHGTQVCAGCHKVHGQGDTVALVPSLLGQEQTATCLACHNGSANSAKGTNIGAQLTASTNPLAHHGVSPAEQDSGRTKVDCADCHQPHSVSAATPLTDPRTGAPYTGKVLDPSDQVIARASADTFIVSSFPAANRGGIKYARAFGKPGDATQGRALLKFDSYQYPPAARIKKATLQVMSTNSGYRRGTIRAYPLTADWSQGTDAIAYEGSATSVGATWDKSYVPAGAAWATPGGDYTTAATGVGTIDSASRYQRIDVTDVVKWQLANVNRGIVLLGDTSISDLMFVTADQNYSESAVIVFELDTAAPETDDVAYCGTCHATASPPAGIKTGATRSLTTWTATDVHGGGVGQGMYATGGYDAGGGLKAPYYYGYPSMTCATCHDTHGTSNAFHLRERVNGVATATNIAADGTGAIDFCEACHSLPHHTVLGDWQDCFGCHHHGISF